MTSSTVTLDVPPLLLERFLTGYWSVRTRANYAFIIGGWFTWCASREHDPMRDADPRVLERWVTDMQHRPYAANTPPTPSAPASTGLRLSSCSRTHHR